MDTQPRYNELAGALRDRLEAIGDRELSKSDPAAHLALLRNVSERIDALHAALPRPLDPELDHFLQRRSYDKALAWLEAQ